MSLLQAALYATLALGSVAVACALLVGWVYLCCEIRNEHLSLLAALSPVIVFCWGVLLVFFMGGGGTG